MEDGRKKNGGHSTKGFAGRKPKADEIKLIEKLDDLINKDSVVKKLNELITEGNFNALKLYFEYRYGKPKESIDLTSKGESLSFNELLGFDKTKREV
jgi:hypothetical protein